MIEVLDFGDETIIAYRVGGKVTEDEMKEILALFRERIDQGKKLNIYQEVVSIGGVEFDAMVEKFRFFKETGFSNFNRVAVVTHKRWIHHLVDLEDKLFKNIEMKGFSIEDKDAAITFLQQP